MEVPCIKAKNHIIAAYHISHVKFVGTYNIAFRSYSKELSLNSINQTVAAELLFQNFIKGLFQDTAFGYPVGRQIL